MTRLDYPLHGTQRPVKKGVLMEQILVGVRGDAEFMLDARAASPNMRSAL